MALRMKIHTNKINKERKLINYSKKCGLKQADKTVGIVGWEESFSQGHEKKIFVNCFLSCK